MKRGSTASYVLLGIIVAAVFFWTGITVDRTIALPVPPFGGTAGLSIATLGEAASIIENNYYRPDISPSQLTNGALRGFISSLGDRFSAYLTPKEYKAEQEGFGGKYSGIGVYIEFTNDLPQVAGFIPDSPAEQAGIRIGDIIVAVNGVSTKGMSANRVASIIQGPAGTKVKITVERNGKDYTYSVARRHLVAPSVDAVILPGNILYVRIYFFGSDTVSSLNYYLSKYVKKASGLILDLRDNPGGYVTAAQHVIGDFISNGTAFEFKTRSGVIEKQPVEGAKLALHIPMITLVNGNTASAAEIVSSALQESGRSKLLGTKTFGKGSVQEDFVLRNGGDLHLTVMHWLTMDGKSINRIGIEPNIVVPMPKNAKEFDPLNKLIPYTEDPQLMAALKLLRK